MMTTMTFAVVLLPMRWLDSRGWHLAKEESFQEDEEDDDEKPIESLTIDHDECFGDFQLILGHTFIHAEGSTSIQRIDLEGEEEEEQCIGLLRESLPAREQWDEWYNHWSRHVWCSSFPIDYVSIWRRSMGERRSHKWAAVEMSHGRATIEWSVQVQLEETENGISSKRTSVILLSIIEHNAWMNEWMTEGKCPSMCPLSRSSHMCTQSDSTSSHLSLCRKTNYSMVICCAKKKKKPLLVVFCLMVTQKCLEIIEWVSATT